MTAPCTRCHGAGSIVTHDADSDQWPRITCPRCWGEPMAQPTRNFVDPNPGEHVAWLIEQGHHEEAAELQTQQYIEGVKRALEGREVGDFEPAARYAGYIGIEHDWQDEPRNYQDNER